MRITKVYTKVGDRGTTRLVGGVEVSKDDARIEAYGTVDELNSVLGQVRALVRPLPEAARDRVETLIAAIQNDLFDVGADLATPAAHRWATMVRVGPEDHARLEEAIDAFNAELEPLREFVLPAGGLAGATLHVARTVCRRAERRVATLQHAADDVGTGCLIYLNRLSDLLFVLARWVARADGEVEAFWKPRG